MCEEREARERRERMEVVRVSIVRVTEDTGHVTLADTGAAKAAIRAGRRAAVEGVVGC